MPSTKNTIILELLDQSPQLPPKTLANFDRRTHSNNDDEGREWIADFLENFALTYAGYGRASNLIAACLEGDEVPTKAFAARGGQE